MRSLLCRTDQGIEMDSITEVAEQYLKEHNSFYNSTSLYHLNQLKKNFTFHPFLCICCKSDFKMADSV